MQLTLYNTARKKQETVTQPTDRPLGIYSCGITAYDYAHIGNLRHYVMDDLLIRTLKYDGYSNTSKMSLTLVISPPIVTLVKINLKKVLDVMAIRSRRLRANLKNTFMIAAMI